MMSPFRSAFAALALGVVLLASEGRPCGPFFSNRLLLLPTENAQAIPCAGFEHEIRRIAGYSQPWQVWGRGEEATAAAELGDLYDLKLAATWVDVPVWSYRLLGTRLTGDTAALHELPAEMRRYLAGAHAWHTGDGPKASREWLELMKMPADQRRLRSVWAAFMLGRTAIGRDNADVQRWFEVTRTLASTGFADRLGLAASSWGWQARAVRDGTPAGQVREVGLYVQQVKAGDHSGFVSLRLIVPGMMEQTAVLDAAAADPVARRVLTAWLLSYLRGSEHRTVLAQKWLEAIERQAPKMVADADRLAWLHCRLGQYDLCQRWLDRAQPADAVADWLRAKLALRAGKLDQAAKLLRSAARAFPLDESWANGDEFEDDKPQARAQGELALVLLPRRNYLEAFDLLLRAGWWTDAAWIGERVLTIEELRSWVQRHPVPAAKAPDLAAQVTGSAAAPGPAPAAADADSQKVRELLGHRLMRLGKFAEALPLLSDADRAAGKTYADALKTGDDTKLPAPARALAIWQAATTAREKGMEIMGTEVDPDWRMHEGSYAQEETLAERRKDAGVLRPSEDELRRVQQSAPVPEQRFHYRALAANLALRAAQLLPDADPRGELMLCHGASWVHVQHPDASRPLVQEWRKRYPNSALAGTFAQKCPPLP